MADFFAVRIEEEGLYDDLKTLLTTLQLPTPLPALERLKGIAAGAPDCNTFIEGVKAGDMFPTMRDLLTKVRLG